MGFTAPTHGHFVISPVTLALRDPHVHLRSHGKIGDCEQSRMFVETAIKTLTVFKKYGPSKFSKQLDLFS